MAKRATAPSAVTASAPVKSATKPNFNINDIRVGDIFSEEPHFIYQGKEGEKYKFLHLESDNLIALDKNYVEELLSTANQYERIEKVGREDKYWTAKQIAEYTALSGKSKEELPRVGDLKVKGIRSIWNDIHSAQVFTVVYQTKSKDLSDTALAKAKQDQLDQAVAELEASVKAKKGASQAALAIIKKIQDNPVQSVIPGDLRTLKGYKTQFSSITGQYDVIDMEIPKGESRKRQVNVNTIVSLIYNNVKYVVE